MPSVTVFLFKNTGVGFVGGVGGESDGFPRLEGADEDVIPDIGEDPFEGRLMSRSPFPGLIFLGEIGEAGGRI